MRNKFRDTELQQLRAERGLPGPSDAAVQYHNEHRNIEQQQAQAAHAVRQVRSRARHDAMSDPARCHACLACAGVLAAHGGMVCHTLCARQQHEVARDLKVAVLSTASFMPEHCLPRFYTAVHADAAEQCKGFW